MPLFELSEMSLTFWSNLFHSGSSFTELGSVNNEIMITGVKRKLAKQESIPVGCTPPAFLFLGGCMMSLHVWSHVLSGGGGVEGGGSGPKRGMTLPPCEQNYRQV